MYNAKKSEGTKLRHGVPDGFGLWQEDRVEWKVLYRVSVFQ